MTPESAAGKAIVAYGEVLLRLRSPGFERLLQSPRLEVCIGGAEMNVLASLSRFGHDTRLVTTLPDHALGEFALAEIRALGIGTSGIYRRPGRIGLYFLEAGHGSRPAQILYDRAASAFALDASARAWTELLSNTALVHLTGITPALSVQAAASSLEAAQHARRAGAAVSVDVNLRPQVWKTAPRPLEQALVPLLHEANILFASSGDLVACFGFRGDPAARSPIEEFEHHAAQALERLPQLELICTCLRLGNRADHARLIALGRTRQEVVRSAEREIYSIVDRIGTGDAFAAGVIHQRLRGQPLGQSLDFGIAAAVLKHGIPGDANRVSEAEVHACAAGESGAPVLR